MNESPEEIEAQRAKARRQLRAMENAQKAARLVERYENKCLALWEAQMQESK